MTKRIVTISTLFLLVCVLGLGLIVQAETTSNAKTAAKKTLDPACMQKAVEKRDNAIIAGLDTYHSSVKTALEKRRDELKNAWGINTVKERRAALKTAWKNFKGTWNKTSKDLKNVKKAAWKQFYLDRKACGSSGASDDPTTESVDSGL